MNIYTTMHFTLMGAAAVLFIAAMMTARGKKGAGWFFRHRRLAFTGVAAAVAGVLSIAYLKFSMNYPHFKSPHAIGGLVTMFAILASPVFGTLTAAGKRGMRAVHRNLGRVTVILVVITAVFGVLRLLQIMKMI